MSSIVSQYKTDLAIAFLNHSNRIESIHEIDYNEARYQKVGEGHFGGFIHSQELAKKQNPLSVKQIVQWQSLLTREQLPFGYRIEEDEIGHIRNPSTLKKNVRIGNHIPPDYSRVPTLLDFLVEDINEALRNAHIFRDDVEYCKFVATRFLRFERIHPFADGNGRVGRLLANYIATYCGRPLFVFHSEMSERNQYYKAHESEDAMTKFMANKIQETIIGMNGTLLSKNKDLSGSSALYSSKDSNEKEIIHWHHLDNAILHRK